jgi:hypothetical protein
MQCALRYMCLYAPRIVQFESVWPALANGRYTSVQQMYCCWPAVARCTVHQAVAVAFEAIKLSNALCIMVLQRQQCDCYTCEVQAARSA